MSTMSTERDAGAMTLRPLVEVTDPTVSAPGYLVEFYNEDEALIARQATREYVPLETEADLIAAAAITPAGYGHAGRALVEDFNDLAACVEAGDDRRGKMPCRLCRTLGYPVFDVKSGWGVRPFWDVWQEHADGWLLQFDVEWDPTLRF